MRAKTFSILAILLSLLLIGCATSTSNFPLHTRQSFVKIEKTINFNLCPPGEEHMSCTLSSGLITGSGSIVRKTSKGSYVLTAGHVCDSSREIPAEIRSSDTTEVIIEAVDLEFKRYYSQIINVNMDMDTCILFVHDLRNEPIEFANFQPKEGDRAYNVAAPTGVFYIGTVPLLEGFYMGIRAKDQIALYTVPAAGGSSGSPIFNTDGELIGMIHSVNRYFPMITVSPTLPQIKRFVFNSIMKHKRELILLQKKLQKQR